MATLKNAEELNKDEKLTFEELQSASGGFFSVGASCMRKTRITILAILFLLTIFFVATAEGDGWTKEGDYLCYYENGNRLVGTQFVFNQMYNFTQEGYLQSDGNVQRLTNGSATCKITVK